MIMTDSDDDHVVDGDTCLKKKNFKCSGSTLPRNALCWLQGRGKGLSKRSEIWCKLWIFRTLVKETAGDPWWSGREMEGKLKLIKSNLVGTSGTYLVHLVGTSGTSGTYLVNTSGRYGCTKVVFMTKPVWWENIHQMALLTHYKLFANSQII